MKRAFIILFALIAIAADINASEQDVLVRATNIKQFLKQTTFESSGCYFIKDDKVEKRFYKYFKNADEDESITTDVEARLVCTKESVNWINKFFKGKYNYQVIPTSNLLSTNQYIRKDLWQKNGENKYTSKQGESTIQFDPWAYQIDIRPSLEQGNVIMAINSVSTCSGITVTINAAVKHENLIYGLGFEYNFSYTFNNTSSETNDFTETAEKNCKMMRSHPNSFFVTDSVRDSVNINPIKKLKFEGAGDIKISDITPRDCNAPVYISRLYYLVI